MLISQKIRQEHTNDCELIDENKNSDEFRKLLYKNAGPRNAFKRWRQLRLVGSDEKTWNETHICDSIYNKNVNWDRVSL